MHEPGKHETTRVSLGGRDSSTDHFQDYCLARIASATRDATPKPPKVAIANKLPMMKEGVA